MNREEFLKTLIENRDGNVKSFSERIKVPYTTVRTILEKGVGNARVDNVIKICNGLNIKPEELNKNIEYSTFISDTVTNMTKLQPPRQEKVLNYAEEQLEEQNNEVRNIEKEPDNIISLDNHREKVAHPKMQSACAGDIGETLQDTPEEYEYFYPEDIPPTSDFCSLVNGDSMEPIMRENSYAFVEYTQYYKSGMIALITLNGQAYFKKIEDYEDTVKLVSANPNYKDIIITSEDDFKLIGKVVQ